MKAKKEMTRIEQVVLLAEYERMLGIARERNCLSQEFRLEEMIKELKEIMADDNN